MFALIAVILSVLAGFDVRVGEFGPFDLLCFAVAALAVHLAYPVPLRR